MYQIAEDIISKIIIKFIVLTTVDVSTAMGTQLLRRWSGLLVNKLYFYSGIF